MHRGLRREMSSVFLRYWTYAMGSGHFLVEAMDEIQPLIEGMNDSRYADSVRNKIKAYCVDKYGWAKDFVFGTE